MTFVLFAITAASSSYSWGTRFAPVQRLRRVDKRGLPVCSLSYWPSQYGPEKLYGAVGGQRKTLNQKQEGVPLLPVFAFYFPLLDFAIDLAATSCLDKMKPQAREAFPLRGGDQRRAGVRPHRGSGGAW